MGSVGAAKQLFENSSQQDAKYSARFSKLEKKPISATQQANKPPEMGDKKVPAWARSQTAKEGEKENAGKPSWIVLAEVCVYSASLTIFNLLLLFLHSKREAPLSKGRRLLLHLAESLLPVVTPTARRARCHNWAMWHRD